MNKFYADNDDEIYGDDVAMKNELVTVIVSYDTVAMVAIGRQKAYNWYLVL